MKFKEYFNYHFGKKNQNLIKSQTEIYEGLILSYDLNVIRKHLKLKFPTIRVDSDKTSLVQNSLGDIKIQLPVDRNQIDYIIRYVNTAGWFIATVNFFKRRKFIGTIQLNQITDELLTSTNVLQLVIEAKFGTELKLEELLKHYPKLYHITPTKNVSKILKVGLTPKTQSKLSNHPDRIYLTTNSSDLPMLKQIFVDITKIKDWTDLEIDTNFVKLTRARLFFDPALTPTGVFTLTNIPPNYIKVIE